MTQTHLSLIIRINMQVYHKFQRWGTGKGGKGLKVRNNAWKGCEQTQRLSSDQQHLIK